MWHGNRKEAGGAGEAAALKQLQSRGLKLVLRNHRCRMGEIDLVMLDGNVLVLIEVRYRNDDSFGGAAASVTTTKQRRLIAAARHLLAMRSDLRRYPARFDVVALSHTADGTLALDWIKNAFRADGS